MNKMNISIILFVSIAMIFFVSCSKDKDNPVNDDDGLVYSGNMVLVESAGASFQMGSNDGIADEQPVHTVSFTGDFWLDTVEVSQGEYDALMTASYSAYLSPTWQVNYGQGDDYPAYSVYWGDAALYCNALSRAEGLDSVYTYSSINGIPGCFSELENAVIDYAKNGYRLPTEAEWEYACRAGSTADFFWGKDYAPYPSVAADTTEISSYCVWGANSWDIGVGNSGYGTHPVGEKIPNTFGLYDMSGNVYEWCGDWYGDYTGGVQTDPTGPSGGTWHAVRGGSWGNYALHLRSSNRTFNCPGYEYYFLGFRCARNAE